MSPRDRHLLCSTSSSSRSGSPVFADSYFLISPGRMTRIYAPSRSRDLARGGFRCRNGTSDVARALSSFESPTDAMCPGDRTIIEHLAFRITLTPKFPSRYHRAPSENYLPVAFPFSPSLSRSLSRAIINYWLRRTESSRESEDDRTFCSR